MASEWIFNTIRAARPHQGPGISASGSLSKVIPSQSYLTPTHGEESRMRHKRASLHRSGSSILLFLLIGLVLAPLAAAQSAPICLPPPVLTPVSGIEVNCPNSVPNSLLAELRKSPEAADELLFFWR